MIKMAIARDRRPFRRVTVSVSFAAMILGSFLGRFTLAQGPDRPPRFAPPTTYLPSQSIPLVALRFVFRTGSQDDPPGKEGLAALTAAMVTEGGAAQLTYEQILNRFYPMASGLAGACRKEVTVFAGEVHRDNLATYVPLVSVMLTQPRFDPEDFARLKNEAIDFVAKTLRSSGDEELGKWTLQVELFKNHPYGHVDRGTVDGLKSITLDDVKAFHREHYTRESLVLGVAGSANQEVLSEVRRFLAELPTRPSTPRPLPKPEMPRGLDVTIVKKPTESTAISLGFPIDITRQDDDFYALAIANSYLGEHRTFNGKLMQDLRARRGLNYGDFSYVEDFIQEGPSTFAVPNNPRRQQYFSIWVRPVPHDKAGFALRAALWELDRLLKEGMSPADFEATRTYLLNYSKLWVQTLSRRLGYKMDGTFYGRQDLVTEMAERLPKLTVEQVNAAVRRHLRTTNLKIAIVTRDAESLARTLKTNAPTPITYDTQGTAEAILNEDKVIAVFPLRDVTLKIVPVAEMFQK